MYCLTIKLKSTDLKMKHKNEFTRLPEHKMLLVDTPKFYLFLLFCQLVLRMTPDLLEDPFPRTPLMSSWFPVRIFQVVLHQHQISMAGILHQQRSWPSSVQ